MANDGNVEITNGDLYTTKPGTLAGRYLRTFWQPVARAEDVKRERAYPARVLNEALTVYRGSTGQVHVTQFACPHRAAQLSAGWVEGDAIRCRYHGWKFGADGACLEQPGEEPGFASKVVLRTYPAQEYLGLIFAYLGPGEPPPLRRFPDFERAGVLEVGAPEFWPCNYFNRLDNACDVVHLPFTHRVSVARAGLDWRLTVPAVNSAETEYGIRTTEERPGRPISYSHFHMPNVNQVRARGRIEGTLADAASIWGDRLFFRLPVDDEHCISFVVDYFPLFGDAAEAYRSRRRETHDVGLAEVNATGDAVLRGERRLEDVDPGLSTYKGFWIEDYTVQVGQQPISDEREERLGKNDVGVILLRKLWRRELQALAEERPLTAWHTPAGLAEMTPELVAPQ
jgi:5,5'-dehydrodivanillate O-demethylase